jgi:hypothetical protein
MKTFTVFIISAVIALFSSYAKADTPKEKDLHDMHMIMQFMDLGLCSAIEGANMQMLGQMGTSTTVDKDATVHGTIMVKDGKAMIREMLDGRAMQELYKRGTYDKEAMDDLHELGERMLRVIEQVEKIHKSAIK